MFDEGKEPLSFLRPVGLRKQRSKATSTQVPEQRSDCNIAKAVTSFSFDMQYVANLTDFMKVMNYHGSTIETRHVYDWLVKYIRDDNNGAIINPHIAQDRNSIGRKALFRCGGVKGIANYIDEEWFGLERLPRFWESPTKQQDEDEWEKEIEQAEKDIFKNENRGRPFQTISHQRLFGLREAVEDDEQVDRDLASGTQKIAFPDETELRRPFVVLVHLGIGTDHERYTWATVEDVYENFTLDQISRRVEDLWKIEEEARTNHWIDKIKSNPAFSHLLRKDSKSVVLQKIRGDAVYQDFKRECSIRKADLEEDKKKFADYIDSRKQDHVDNRFILVTWYADIREQNAWNGIHDARPWNDPHVFWGSHWARWVLRYTPKIVYWQQLIHVSSVVLWLRRDFHTAESEKASTGFPNRFQIYATKRRRILKWSSNVDRSDKLPLPPAPQPQAGLRSKRAAKNVPPVDPPRASKVTARKPAAKCEDPAAGLSTRRRGQKRQTRDEPKTVNDYDHELTKRRRNKRE